MNRCLPHAPGGAAASLAPSASDLPLPQIRHLPTSSLPRIPVPLTACAASRCAGRIGTTSSAVRLPGTTAASPGEGAGHCLPRPASPSSLHPSSSASFSCRTDDGAHPPARHGTTESSHSHIPQPESQQQRTPQQTSAPHPALHPGLAARPRRRTPQQKPFKSLNQQQKSN